MKGSYSSKQEAREVTNVAIVIIPIKVSRPSEDGRNGALLPLGKREILSIEYEV